MEENDGDRPNEGWWRFGEGLDPELLSQKKFDVTQVVQAGISGPHASKDLRHITEISFNVAPADGSSV